MLILTRHRQHFRGHCEWLELVVGDHTIYIGVVDVRGDKARIGIDASPGVTVNRVFTCSGQVPSQAPQAVVRETR